MREAVDRFNAHTGAALDVVAVENVYLGSEINVSGLLSGQDLLAAFAGRPATGPLYVSDRMVSQRTGTLLDDRPSRRSKRHSAARSSRPAISPMSLAICARGSRARRASRGVSQHPRICRRLFPPRPRQRTLGHRRSSVPRSTHWNRSGRALLRVRIAAPPVDGAANAALLRFLADVLDVPRLALAIVSGEISRHKRSLVEESRPTSSKQRLQEALGRER